MKYIFATGNDHKVKEARQILSNFPFESLAEISFYDEIVEDGDTLKANALIKARHIYKIYKRNVFSEDTGLEVTSLNMEPGVITARYAGASKDFNDNMDLLLHNLKTHKDRSARFRAIVALIINGEEFLFEGIINGKIALKKSGVKGFGYDPVFIPEGYEKSFAELDPSVKSELSHRARALRKMKSFLDQK